MPSILRESGWRIYFYSNEGEEPIHVHARKGDMECKFRLLMETYELQEVWSNGLTTAGRREVKKIIYKNFDFILSRWDEFFNYL